MEITTLMDKTPPLCDQIPFLLASFERVVVEIIGVEITVDFW